MSGSTTKDFPSERRISRRVPVLFSALLKRKGWRSQMVDVVDLSESGAKVLLGFDVPAGAEVVLRMQGARRKLEVPSHIANVAGDPGLPVAGLRFAVPEDVRGELREIVERVELARSRAAGGRKSKRGGGDGTA